MAERPRAHALSERIAASSAALDGPASVIAKKIRGILPSGGGIKDVLAKSLGSSNHANVVKATIEALRGLRRKDEIFKTRGIRPSVTTTPEGKADGQ